MDQQTLSIRRYGLLAMLYLHGINYRLYFGIKQKLEDELPYSFPRSSLFLKEQPNACVCVRGQLGEGINFSTLRHRNFSTNHCKILKQPPKKLEICNAEKKKKPQTPQKLKASALTF